MKRRDSLPSLFSGHGSKNLLDEDEALLISREDVSPPKETDLRSSRVVDKADSSSSWYTEADSELEDSNCNKLIDQNFNFANKRHLGSRERLHRSLSDLFSRVGKPKIQTSRSQRVVKQNESKILGNVDKVNLKCLLHSHAFTGDIYLQPDLIYLVILIEFRPPIGH